MKKIKLKSKNLLASPWITRGNKVFEEETKVI